MRIALIGRDPKRTLIRATVLAIVCFIFFKFYFYRAIVLPVQVQGNSMFPTYHDHAWNYLNKLAYWHSEPQRGDVVGIRMSGEHAMLLKRIVGLPGEIIAFKNGHLFVNGNEIEEPYMKTFRPAPDLAPVTLRPDEYYVIGDNRMNSERGRIDRSRIVGRVIL